MQGRDGPDWPALPELKRAQTRQPPVQRRQRIICPMAVRSDLFRPQKQPGRTQIDVAHYSAQNHCVLKKQNDQKHHLTKSFCGFGCCPLRNS
jgi:hypothetical protein